MSRIYDWESWFHVCQYCVCELNSLFVTHVGETKYTQKMGRLSEEIMTLFGVKPSDEPIQFPFEFPGVSVPPVTSTAPTGMFIIKFVI